MEGRRGAIKKSSSLKADAALFLRSRVTRKTSPQQRIHRSQAAGHAVIQFVVPPRRAGKYRQVVFMICTKAVRRLPPIECKWHCKEEKLLGHSPTKQRRDSRDKTHGW